MKTFRKFGVSAPSAAGVASIVVLCLLLFSCGQSSRSLQNPSSPSTVTRGSQAQMSLADVLRQIDSFQPSASVDQALFEMLRSELKKKIIARSDGKTLSTIPSYTGNKVVQIQAFPGPNPATQEVVSWRERFWGDYDDNGVVNIADLQPVALYYGQRTDTSPPLPHSPRELVQGDTDPEINIGDLDAIAKDYGDQLDGYQLWRGHLDGNGQMITDPPMRPNPNSSNPAWSADRPTPQYTWSHPLYTYTDDISGLADKTNVRYHVRPCCRVAPVTRPYAHWQVLRRLIFRAIIRGQRDQLTRMRNTLQGAHLNEESGHSAGSRRFIPPTR